MTSTPSLRSPSSPSVPRLPIACLALMALGAVVVIGIAQWTSSPTRPTSRIVLPLKGAKLEGNQILDAVTTDTSTVTRVEFQATGGSLHDALVGTATTHSDYGWFARWNTTTVPNGSYGLQAVAYDIAGRAIRSPDVTISVDH